MYLLVCESSGILKIFAFLKIIMNIIFIVAPIGLIVMVSVDFAKAVISGDAEAQKKSVELGFNRILYAAILFAVPYIVNLFMTLISAGSEYANCLSLAGDPKAIAKLEKEEEARKEAKKKADEEARQIEVEKFKERTEAQNLVRVNPITVKGEGCDGVVYYEDGTYYKPSSALVPKNGVAKTKGSAAYGYNKYFYEDLLRLIEAAKKEGYIITASTTEYGAWRSYENQVYFWNCYQTQKCNNGNLAATPGKSNHGWGIASDLQYHTNGAASWANKNAKKYNLIFRVPGENWHIEPLSIKENDEKARACV